MVQTSAKHRRGLTLIEVLVATTLTLLMMLALAQGFKTMSDSITAGRSRLTMADQLRGITNLLRSDLQGRTTDGSVPQSTLNANGYFLYYDGPLSDASAMLFSYVSPVTNQGASPEQRLSANRWGDLDDVLMFTTRAKPGEWFHGKIPRALLLIHNMNNGLTAPVTITPDDWYANVSIASEYAEIAWFVRPLNDLGGIDLQEVPQTVPNYGYNPKDTVQLNPTPVPVTPVRDNGGTDLNGDGLLDPDGIPDKLALCRRVLLIRPDLNISLGGAVTSVGTNDPQLSMQPLPPDMGSVDSFRYMMRFPYQRSDLSVRPVLVGSTLTVATNSLADLQRPENRFAHFVVPDTSGSSDSTSLPILALTSEVESNGNYIPLVTRATESLGVGVTVSLNDRGFIPSAFFRTQVFPRTDPSMVGLVVPTLNEVIAPNIAAFDIKGFDPSAQKLASRGADNAWGAAGVDDDGDGTIDNVTEFGFPGTDDIALSPSDPGYAQALLDYGTALVVAEDGAYVDVGWAWKVINQRDSFIASSTTLANYFSGLGGPPPRVWGSSLSCFDPVSLRTTDSMMKSGRAFIAPATATMLDFQPTFDTFTDAYESDGYFQESIFNGNLRQVVWHGGARRLIPGLTIGTIANADRGTNGFDDDSNGVVDDEFEKETSSPIAVALPSIQITVRVQDPQASMIQQLSVVESLVD